MRKKLCCLLFSVLTVAMTWNLWFGYNGKIVFQTNVPEKQEITLTYKHDGDGTPVKVKTKADKSGKLTFNVNGHTINRFKIHVKEDVAIDAVKFYGAKAQNITVAENLDFSQRGLVNDWHVDWWNLIVLAAFGWYIGWFLFYCLNNGIPTDDSKLPKFLNIEFLRVFFTLGVVCYHFVPRLGVWCSGLLGVEFFFILSGFLLALTFRPERSVGDFITDKWIRFMPLIVFGGLLTTLFVENVHVRFFLEQFAFVANGFLFKAVSYNGPAWYIFALFWILLLYFYALKYFRRETVNLWMGVLTVAATAYMLKYNDEVTGIVSSRLMRGVAGVGMGYFLAYIYQALKDKQITRKTMYNIFELVVFLFATLNIFIKPLSQGKLVACISFMLIILMFVLRKGIVSQFFEKPIFAKMARYCLAIYLTHRVIVIEIFKIYLERYNELFLARPIIPITAVLTATILLGIVAHHLIELPFTRTLKKITK